MPSEVSAPLRAISPEASDSSWAMRFIEGYGNVKLILSGMSSMAQLTDNLSTFVAPNPLNEREYAAVKAAADALRARTYNGCTACRYCMPCPHGVNIPRMFHIWNAHARYGIDASSRNNYLMTSQEERAQRCVECGECEPMCPQDIQIRADLKKVASEAWASETDD